MVLQPGLRNTQEGLFTLAKDINVDLRVFPEPLFLTVTLEWVIGPSENNEGFRRQALDCFGKGVGEIRVPGVIGKSHERGTLSRELLREPVWVLEQLDAGIRCAARVKMTLYASDRIRNDIRIDRLPGVGKVTKEERCFRSKKPPTILCSPRTIQAAGGAIHSRCYDYELLPWTFAIGCVTPLRTASS